MTVARSASIAHVAMRVPSSIEKKAAWMSGVPTSGRLKPFWVAMMSSALAKAKVKTSTSATPWTVSPW